MYFDRDEEPEDAEDEIKQVKKYPLPSTRSGRGNKPPVNTTTALGEPDEDDIKLMANRIMAMSPAKIKLLQRYLRDRHGW